MTTDSELLRRYVQSQSEDAFGELVRRHLNLVFRAAMRQTGGDTHRAQDVAQSVFILVAQRAAALADHGSLAGWLHTTTAHVVRNALREERRRQAREREAFFMNTETGGVDVARNASLPDKALDEILGGLGAQDREAILLRFFEERSFAEVGLAMRISEDAARMRVARSLEKLRAGLGRRGIVSTTAALGTLLTAEGAMAAPAGFATTVTTAALAGGKSVSLVAGVLTFMSTTKFVSAAAVLCIGLAVSVAVVEARRERVARDGLNEAKRNQDRLIARVTEAEVRARTARGEVITAQEVLERKRAGAARARVPSEEEVAGRALLAAHPAVKEALRSTLRASIRAQHYLLYRELGLSEAQQAAFEDIKLDGEEGLTRTYSHDIGLALPVGEGISSSEVSRRLFRLLGKEGYDKYMSGEFGLKGNPVTALASALYFGDEPLSTEQARQLVRARSEEFTVTTFEERKADPGKLWVGVAERARDFLTEGQMEALQLLKLRDEFHLRPRETIKEAAAPAGRRP